MKLFSFSAFVVAVAVVFVDSAVADPADGKPRPPHGPPKCNGEDVKLTDELRQTVNSTTQSCMTKLKISDNKGMEDSTRLCFMLCTVQGLGMVDSAGKIVISKVTELANAMFSTTSATAMVSAISTCASEKGANVVIKEGDCSSFAELDKCITTALQEVCKMG